MILPMLLAMTSASIVPGFTVKSVEELPDISAKLWRLEYEKNGADIVWVECADENRAFQISFRTQPENDTGVAHVLEHAVLCGSEKYPSREPFVELLKSSPQTYLNAYTAKDVTGYPVASRNEKDFSNLISIYLDAVFHPVTAEQDWPMRQEGWHYEYDGTSLTRNGIVYSEMKGAMANPHTKAYHAALRLLFPESVYRFNSGGDPKHIPELNFADYQAFHTRYYHPSNARIFLYGKIDLPKTLALIGSWLAPYERRAAESAIPWQKPVTASEEVRFASLEEKDRTFVLDGWVVGSFDEIEKLQALDLLSELLTGSNFSPLKEPLLKAGLCEDVSLGLAPFQQPVLLLSFQNVKDGQVAACRELVRETLERLIKEGFDTSRISQLLDKQEFKWRERDTANRGIEMSREVLQTWLYGGDPAQNLRMGEIFKSLRQKNGTGWYEQILKAAIVMNNHRCEVTMVPSKTLAAEEEVADRTELKRIQAGMTETELAQIAAEAAALKARHAQSEDPAILAKLPKLTLDDVPETSTSPSRTITTNAGVTVIRPAIPLSGFFYLDLCFDLTGLTAAERLDVPLLTDVFGEVRSLNRSAAELKGAMDGTFGSFTVDVSAYELGSRLVVHLAALDSHRAAALDLAEEILLRTDFTDTTAIAQIRTQQRVYMEESSRGRGAFEFAQLRAASSYSAAGLDSERFRGITQLRHLQQDEAGDLKALAAKILTRENLALAVAGDIDGAFIAEVVGRFPSYTRRSPSLSRDGDIACTTRTEAFEIDGRVGYAAAAMKRPENVPYHGAQQVAARIISLEQLWPELRVKGGAYGASFFVRPSGTLSFASYRDPNPARSFAEYAKAGEKLAAFVKAGQSFEKYQVSVAENTDPNLSPREEMSRIRALYFNGRPENFSQRVRHEILSTTADDLLAFAETLTRVAPTATQCVVGGKDLLPACEPVKTEKILLSAD